MARSRTTQRGAALILLAAVLVLGVTYLIVSHMNSQANFLPRQRAHNAEVLNRAKQALIGYTAMMAEKAGEQDPGALLCPEPAAFFNDSDNEGKTAASCTLPAVGRLPWRTLGLDKLTDATGEPLWYVVSPGWAKPSPGANTVINSNTAGQLTVDGTANDAVALIIAPGLPLPGQSRGGSAAVNYLDGENATLDAIFVTTGPTASFNDQVLRITTRDVLPAIEAAISRRIEREIVPALKTVYADSGWSANISSTNPVYPFPAPFADPGVGASFRGSAASCAGNDCQGLFPAIFSNVPGSSAPCTPANGVLCDPSFVRWTGGTVQRTGGANMNPSPATCSVVNVTVAAGPPATETTRLDCVFYASTLLGLNGNLDFRMQGTVANVGMALRRFDPAATMPAVTVTTTDVTLNPDGSASVTIEGRVVVGPSGLGDIVGDLFCTLLPFLFACREVTMSFPMAFFPDHALLDSRPTLAPGVPNPTGWFMRNQWPRVLYYATAPGVTPGVLPAQPNCTPGTNCLTLNGVDDKRAVLLLAGRSLTGTAGDSRVLPDFLDSAENRDGNEVFATQPAGARFNDRAVIVQVD